jgi:hypothetical protein
VISSLRERGGTAFGAVRLRKGIVTVQIALSLLLVIGAVLFTRTLTGLLTKGPGFDTSGVVSFGIDPRRNGYSEDEVRRLSRRIYDEIRASAMTRSSAVARFQLLTGGSWNNPMTIQTTERIVTDRMVNLNAVTPGFFATLGIRVVAGRDFDERDSRPPGETGQRTAIVNEAFVNRYLGGRNPLGVRITQGSGPDAKPDTEIVGVVTDFNYRGLREQSEQAYFPLIGGSAEGAHFYVKVRGTPEAAFQSIRTIVHNADPSLPILYLRTGGTGQPLIEHRAHGGNAVSQLRHTRPAAVAGWALRRDVVRGHTAPA